MIRIFSFRSAIATNEEAIGRGAPENEESGFVLRVVRVVESHGQPVTQNRRRLLEGDAVLPQIGFCFGRIPFHLQTHGRNIPLEPARTNAVG
jgi:hypothetical protein